MLTAFVDVFCVSVSFFFYNLLIDVITAHTFKRNMRLYWWAILTLQHLHYLNKTWNQIFQEIVLFKVAVFTVHSKLLHRCCWGPFAWGVLNIENLLFVVQPRPRSCCLWPSVHCPGVSFCRLQYKHGHVTQTFQRRSHQHTHKHTIYVSAAKSEYVIDRLFSWGNHISLFYILQMWCQLKKEKLYVCVLFHVWMKYSTICA